MNVTQLLREFRALLIVCSRVLCCLVLFLVESHITTSLAYIPVLVLLFFTVFGRSLIYALKSVVLVTAPWGIPTVVCLYFEEVSPFLTLVHL